MREILLLKFSLKTTKKWVFIPSFQICPLAAEKGQFALLVDRPFGRPAVKFLTVEPTGRPPGQPGLDTGSNGSLASRPPSRPKPDTESRALCRSTGSVDRGLFQRAEALWRLTDPFDRLPAWLRARPVHVSRPDRSTDSCLGRPAQSIGRQQVQPL